MNAIKSIFRFPVQAPFHTASESMATMHQSVTVRAPATSANLGPGFDAIGLALDLWNEVTVERSSRCGNSSHGHFSQRRFSMHIEGIGADSLPRDETNLVVQAARLGFKKAGVAEMPPLAFFCRNTIPFGGGLGSSSAAIISGLVAAFALTGKTLRVQDEEELLQYAAELEGHVDNISACLYGSLQVIHVS